MPFFLAAAAVLAVGSAIKGNQKRQALKGRASAQARIQRIRNLQARRKIMRNFRQLQANAIIDRAGEGGLDSSRSRGTQASQNSQLSQAIREANEQGEHATEAARLGDKAADHGFESGLLSTASSLALSANAIRSGKPPAAEGQ
jgi:uncharacterized membrane protein